MLDKAARRVRRSTRRALMRAQAAAWLAGHRLRGSQGRVTVLLHPERPMPYAMLHAVCARLGYRVSNDPSAPFDVGVFWQDATVRQPPAALVAAARRGPVLNLRAVDISKSAVESAHLAVFGYSLGVDPLTHVGPVVRKSEENAVHDGTLVQAPVPVPEVGFVYQHLVDTLLPGGLVEDLRIPVLQGDVPYVSYRRRRPQERFGSGGVVEVETVDTQDALSADEAARVAAVAAALGVEYGELDALRSRSDGRLFVVDVNPMPSAPPPTLWRQRRAQVDRMAAAFERAVRDLRRPR